MNPEKVEHILGALEATEANLDKLERLWAKIRAEIGTGPSFGTDPGYENLRREYAEIIDVMPVVGGKKLTDSTIALNEIGQMRLDALELGEFEVTVNVEESVFRPDEDLSEYRYFLRKRRRGLVGDLLQRIVETVDAQIDALAKSRPQRARNSGPATDEPLEALRVSISQIERLLGSASVRPPRWGDLRRHLSFGQWTDVDDIQELDWPTVRPVILEGLRGENDPVPVAVSSLDDLEALPERTAVPTALAFDLLSPEGFERLLFSLVSAERGYENAEWLTRTNAPDRGRDLSVVRVITDGLGGTRRERVVIQCKHWRDSSVGIAEFATLTTQAYTWEPPRVDVLVIATTGRFSADAVLAIEKHNFAAKLPRVEMWADSHLELLLARRPALVVEFGLRRARPIG